MTTSTRWPQMRRSWAPWFVQNILEEVWEDRKKEEEQEKRVRHIGE